MSLPNVIEFAGMPGAGKTTLMGLVRRRLEEHGVQFSVVEEAASHNPLETYKDDLRYTLWNVGWNTLHLTEQLCKENLDVILVDRGFFDLHCWLRFFQARATSKPRDHFEALLRYCESSVWAGGGHSVYLLRSSFQDALGRRGGETGRIVNSATWASLNCQYMPSAYQQRFPGLSVTSLQWFSGDRDAIAERVSNKVLDSINSPY